MKYPSRNWGGSGYPETGKSTFFASAAKAPLIVINSDGRFDGVAELVRGEVIYLKNKLANLRPDLMQSGIEEILFERNDAASIIVDPITNVFGWYARQAGMKRRFGTASTNLMADQQDKADAMAVIRMMVAFGLDTYYIWHLYDHRDAKAKLITDYSVSELELERLRASLNVQLEFFVERGEYGVKVVKARDYGGRKANSDFAIYDPKDNFWRGGAERLERLIYTSFANPQEAVRWAVQQLGHNDPGEMEDYFRQVKADAGAKTGAQMWPAWVEAIDALVAKRQTEKPTTITPPAPAPEPPTSSPVVDEEAQPVADRMLVVHDFEELESASQSRQTAVPEPTVPEPIRQAQGEPVEETQPVQDAGGDQEELFYEGGTAVATEDVADLKIFESKFNRLPFDANQLHNSKKVNVAKGTWQ